jgi:signal transduction histidine kinase
MRERAECFGGHLTIACPPEGGTCVEIVFPLQAARAAG